MVYSCNILSIEEYNSRKYGEDWEVKFSENINVNLENMNGYIFDGNDKIYIFTNDKTILQINTNTFSVTNIYYLLYVPEDISLDIKNDLIYIVNQNGYITKINTNTKHEEIVYKWEPNYYSYFGTQNFSIIHYHIYYKDNKLYLIDGSWEPGLTIYNIATNTINDYSSTIKNIGSLVFIGNTNRFYSWYQYGWNAGIGNSYIQEYNEEYERVDNNTLCYMERDPLECRIFVSKNLEYVYCKNYFFKVGNPFSEEHIFPENIYDINVISTLGVGKKNIYDLTTYTTLKNIENYYVDYPIFVNNDEVFLLSKHFNKIFKINCTR